MALQARIGDSGTFRRGRNPSTSILVHSRLPAGQPLLLFLPGGPGEFCTAAQSATIERFRVVHWTVALENDCKYAGPTLKW
jgi:hypothetical protein